VSILKRDYRMCLPLCAVLVMALSGCIRREESLTAESITTGPGTTVGPATTAGPNVTTSRGIFDDILADEETEETSVVVEEPAEGEVADPAADETSAAPAESFEMIELELELPSPAFRGTPVPTKEANLEKPLGRPRDPFLVPEGTTNLSRGKWVTASDPSPLKGELDFVTDGDKEATEAGCLTIRPGLEWVQIDLGKKSTIYVVLLWHNHAAARVYRDVVVQVSDDPDFLDATTVFNNDYDGSAGLGGGTDMGYVETSEGKLIDCQGVEGRYVRLYSRGNHVDENNHYTEVEVFGRPAE